ncbi:MAG: hypothetical protein LBJ77_02820 [Holosporales bacterium]|jgi:hypothetical protein|nr:hypothetical protein [Holosporales bacterium]
MNKSAANIINRLASPLIAASILLGAQHLMVSKVQGTTLQQESQEPQALYDVTTSRYYYTEEVRQPFDKDEASRRHQEFNEWQGDLLTILRALIQACPSEVLIPRLLSLAEKVSWAMTEQYNAVKSLTQGLTVDYKRANVAYLEGIEAMKEGTLIIGASHAVLESYLQLLPE